MSHPAARADHERLTRRGIPVDPNLRALALGQFANRFGAGAVMTTSALYFTRHQGFTAGQVAAALSFAGVIGLLVQVPAGQLADHRGPREVLTWAMVGAALWAFPPALAHAPWVLAVLLGIQYLFDRSANAIRMGVIAQLAVGGRGVLFKAYLRAVTNSALGLGALCGGLALLVDEPWAYLCAFGLNAVFTALAAWLTTRLPHIPPSPRREGEPRLAVARDLPYLVIVLLTGLFALHFVVMDLGLALYIAQHTEAPTVLISVALVVNTLCVALFQVRFSRRSDSVPAGARALVVGAAFIALGFLLIASADRGSVTWAVVAVMAGVLVHVVGEMIGSGGQWSLQMGLAPHERQGQYQGFAALSWSLVEIAGPPMVAWLCVDQGESGWVVLAVGIMAVALASVPASRWALRTRARYGVHTHSG